MYTVAAPRARRVPGAAQPGGGVTDSGVGPAAGAPACAAGAVGGDAESGKFSARLRGTPTETRCALLLQVRTRIIAQAIARGVRMLDLGRVRVRKRGAGRKKKRE